MRKFHLLALAAISPFVIMGDSCNMQQTSNDKIRDAQEQLTNEGNSQVGVPAIINFREKKLLKEIYEMRDKTKFITHTYTYSEYNGKFKYFCQSIGYPIPYSTQYSAGEAVQRWALRETKDRIAAWGTEKMPQAEPNGLFSPASADGTWVLCKDPNSDEVSPVYVEPKVTTLPFKLPE